VADHVLSGLWHMLEQPSNELSGFERQYLLAVIAVVGVAKADSLVVTSDDLLGVNGPTTHVFRQVDQYACAMLILRLDAYAPRLLVCYPLPLFEIVIVFVGR
jgi:hypothetical protein